LAAPESATYIVVPSVECTNTGFDPAGRLMVVTAPIEPAGLAGVKVETESAVPFATYTGRIRGNRPRARG